MAGWWFSRKEPVWIAPATQDDLAALAEIHAAGFSRSWSEDELASMLKNSNTQIFTARTGETANTAPAGFVMIRQAADEAEIITIATAPRHRGKGVGRALMEHAIRHLHGERAAKLFLEVSETNAPANALYRKLGFRQVGKRDSYYPGAAGKPGPAALVMQLELR